MRRARMILAATALASAFTFLVPTPAQASCTTIDGFEDLGCLERALCPRVIFRNCVQ